jgi:hypothetical protein
MPHGGARKDAGRKPRAEVATKRKLKLSFTEAEYAALCAAVPEGGTLAGFCREVLFKRAELELDRRKEVSVGAALDKGLKSGRAKPGVFKRVRRRAGLPENPR